MAANQGGMIHGLRATWFDVRENQPAAEAVEKYVGREQFFTLIRTGEKTFSLRAHDETTRGGLLLEINAAQIVHNPAYISPGSETALPAAFPADTSQAFVDLDTSAGDIDASGWQPTGLADRAIVQLRKLDRTASTISYTDSAGVAYTFVNRYSEFMTLMWLEAEGAFRLI